MTVGCNVVDMCGEVPHEELMVMSEVFGGDFHFSLFVLDRNDHTHELVTV